MRHTTTRIALAPGECPECIGRGYTVSGVDREPGMEIECNDGCTCLAQRLGAAKANDDDAAVAFVRDLEYGDSYATRLLRILLRNRFGEDYRL